PRSRANESNDAGNQRVAPALCSYLFEAIAKCAAAEEHSLIGLSQPMNVRLAPAPTAHTNDIEPNQVRQRPLHQPERDDIRSHAAHSDDHRPLSNAPELPHSRLAAQHAVIADGHLPP